MTGLYIHIPFCKRRCIYCGFYSTTHLSLRRRYVDALCKEMMLRPSSSPIQTIYLGGGTPSLLEPDSLEQLFIYIYKVYDFATEGIETTIECNPDDVSVDFCQFIKHLPINRVSMGVQTFSEERLRFLHRRHQAADVARAVDLLRRCGINNISIDLMYGFPDEELKDWEFDIAKAVELDVEHISAYCLTYEEGTPLWKLQENMPKYAAPPEERSREMYEVLIDRLKAVGYEHYEISNFAKPSFRSQHNSSYWNGTPYIGIGAAAHSYDVVSRQWNVDDIESYIDAIEKGEIPYEIEILDETTRYNDLVTTALRTKEGINLMKLPPKYRNFLLENAQQSLKNGLLRIENNNIHLTPAALFISDDVMSDLIWI